MKLSGLVRVGQCSGQRLFSFVLVFVLALGLLSSCDHKRDARLTEDEARFLIPLSDIQTNSTFAMNLTNQEDPHFVDSPNGVKKYFVNDKVTPAIFKSAFKNVSLSGEASDNVDVSVSLRSDNKLVFYRVIKNQEELKKLSIYEQFLVESTKENYRLPIMYYTVTFIKLQVHRNEYDEETNRYDQVETSFDSASYVRVNFENGNKTIIKDEIEETGAISGLIGDLDNQEFLVKTAPSLDNKFSEIVEVVNHKNERIDHLLKGLLLSANQRQEFKVIIHFDSNDGATFLQVRKILDSEDVLSPIEKTRVLTDSRREDSKLLEIARLPISIVNLKREKNESNELNFTLTQISSNLEKRNIFVFSNVKDSIVYPYDYSYADRNDVVSIDDINKSRPFMIYLDKDHSVKVGDKTRYKVIVDKLPLMFQYLLRDLYLESVNGTFEYKIYARSVRGGFIAIYRVIDAGEKNALSSFQKDTLVEDSRGIGSEVVRVKVSFKKVDFHKNMKGEIKPTDIFYEDSSFEDATFAYVPKSIEGRIYPSEVTRDRKILKKSDILDQKEHIYVHSVQATPATFFDIKPFLTDSGINVNLEYTENSLRLYEIETDKDLKSNRANNKPILTIPVKHVDFKSFDGDQLVTGNNEIEDNSKNWEDRRFIVPDFSNIQIHTFQQADNMAHMGGCFREVKAELENVKVEKGALNITLRKTMEITNLACIRELWRPFPFTEVDEILKKSSFDIFVHFSIIDRDLLISKNYQPISYPSDVDQKKFGFFTKYSEHFSDFKDYKIQDFKLSRWNPEREEIKYYFSKSLAMPENKIFRDAIIKGIDSINKSFARLGTKFRLTYADSEMTDTSDLRYSMINLIDDHYLSGILGYGPTVVDSKTGEIIRGVVNMGKTELLLVSKDMYIRFATRYNEHVAGKKIVSKKVINEQGDKVTEDVLERIESPSVVDSVKLFLCGDACKKSSEKLSTSFVATNIQPILTSSSIASIDKLTSSLLVDTKKVDDAFFEKMGKQNDDIRKELTDFDKHLNFLRKHNVYLATDFENRSITDYESVHMFDSINGLYNSDGTLKHWLVLNESQQKAIVELLAAHVTEGTFIHEFGHNLGLRHNFYGAGDKHNHYTKEELKDLGYGHVKRSSTSSVMEYLYNPIDDIPLFGKYDMAALKFGYLRKVDIIQNGKIVEYNLGTKTLQDLLKEFDPVNLQAIEDYSKASSISDKERLKTFNDAYQNLVPYKYCTDEDVDRRVDCDRFTEGSNLLDLSKHYKERYEYFLKERTYKDKNIHMFDDMMAENIQFSRVYELFNKIRKIYIYGDIINAVLGKDNVARGCSKTDKIMVPDFCDELKYINEASDHSLKFLYDVMVAPDHTCMLKLVTKTGESSPNEAEADVENRMVTTDNGIVYKWLLKDLYNLMGQKLPKADLAPFPKSCFDPRVQKFAKDKLGHKEFEIVGEFGQLLENVVDNTEYDELLVRGSWVDKFVAMIILSVRVDGLMKTDKGMVHHTGDSVSSGEKMQDLMNSFYNHILFQKPLSTPIMYKNRYGDEKPLEDYNINRGTKVFMKGGSLLSYYFGISVGEFNLYKKLIRIGNLFMDAMNAENVKKVRDESDKIKVIRRDKRRLESLEHTVNNIEASIKDGTVRIFSTKHDDQFEYAATKSHVYAYDILTQIAEIKEEQSVIKNLKDKDGLHKVNGDLQMKYVSLKVRNDKIISDDGEGIKTLKEMEDYLKNVAPTEKEESLKTKNYKKFKECVDGVLELDPMFYSYMVTYFEGATKARNQKLDQYYVPNIDISEEHANLLFDIYKLPLRYFEAVKYVFSVKNIYTSPFNLVFKSSSVLGESLGLHSTYNYSDLTSALLKKIKSEKEEMFKNGKFHSFNGDFAKLEKEVEELKEKKKNSRLMSVLTNFEKGLTPKRFKLNFLKQKIVEEAKTKNLVSGTLDSEKEVVRLTKIVEEAGEYLYIIDKSISNVNYELKRYERLESIEVALDNLDSYFEELDEMPKGSRLDTGDREKLKSLLTEFVQNLKKDKQTSGFELDLPSLEKKIRAAFNFNKLYADLKNLKEERQMAINNLGSEIIETHRDHFKNEVAEIESIEKYFQDHSERIKKIYKIYDENFGDRISHAGLYLWYSYDPERAKKIAETQNIKLSQDISDKKYKELVSDPEFGEMVEEIAILDLEINYRNKDLTKLSQEQSKIVETITKLVFSDKSLAVKIATSENNSYHKEFLEKFQHGASDAELSKFELVYNAKLGVKKNEYELFKKNIEQRIANAVKLSLELLDKNIKIADGFEQGKSFSYFFPDFEKFLEGFTLSSKVLGAAFSENNYFEELIEGLEYLVPYHPFEFSN